MMTKNPYMFPLGRVAVIGAGDLGSHVARAAAAYGAEGILVTGRSRMEKVNAVAEELRGKVPTVALRLPDLKDPFAMDVIEEAEKSLGGPINTFVITVAYQPTTPVEEQTPEEYALVYDTNVIGPYFFAKRVLDRATQRGFSAHVIFVSSDNSLPTEYDPNTPHYDSSKAALNHLVNHLAFRYASAGHQVNAVLPGWIDVSSQENVEGIQEIYRSIAMGRPAKPEEAAVGIIHLAMEPHVTGTLRVIANGGGTNRAHLR